MSERRRQSLSSRSRSHSRQRSHSHNGRPSLVRSPSSQTSIKRSSIESTSHHLALSPYHFSSHPHYHGSIEEHERSDGHASEVPAINASVDHTLPQEYFKTELLNVIKALRISKWHRLPSILATEIQLKRISGALTNAIYRIDAPSVIMLKNHNLHGTVFPPLLLRIYGANADTVIDRTYELKILTKLSKNNIGPKLLGIFKNGRLEQFLDNAITLTKADIMNIKTSARIARRMKELHDGVYISSREKELGPSVSKSIRDWINTIEEWISNNNFEYKSLNETQLFKMSFPKFKKNSLKYLEWIEQKYGPETYKDLVFCHNDTQYGNLLFAASPIKLPTSQQSEKPSTAASQQSLVTNLSNLSLENLPEQLNPTPHDKKEDQNLVVIDFEYSAPNYPAFDISNHFCEWMHNYHHPTKSYALDINDYPSIEEQLNFNYSYVLFRNSEFGNITKANSENFKTLEAQSRMIYNQVIDWRPAVSLFWSLWAILQNGPKSAIDAGEIIETGLHGETYKVVEDEEGDSDQEVDEGVEGNADNDNFEYLLYAQQKLEVLFGDLIQLGVISKDEITEEERENLKYLNVEYFDLSS